MTDLELFPSRQKTARIAGVLYLILAMAMFPELFRNSLIVADNATATAGNILAKAWLFRVSILGDLICQTAFLFLGVVLYGLFRDIHRQASRILLTLVIASVPIAMLNSLNQLAVLLLLQRNELAQAMLFLDLFKAGFLVAEIFWGLWLFPLGWLGFKSGYFPKALGILLIVGCFGYLVDSFLGLVFPASKGWSVPGVGLAAAAEFATVFWLLVFGIKRPKSP